MEIICNSLYRPLLRTEYQRRICFLTNEECDNLAADYDLSDTRMAIMQPFYFNKLFLDRMPCLEIAQITGAGFDRVDVEELKRRNIILCNTRGVMSVSIAEDVFSKMLFFSRKIRRVEQDKKEHCWDMFGQDQWMCSCYEDLYGKTLGIMGYGSIGQEIAKRAEAFGMKIFVYDIHKPADDKITECFTEEKDLLQFYGSVDFLVLCIPLNAHTRHMIDRETFDAMKNTAVLINVARGPLVDTDALLEALSQKKISGAALDVFETEPLLEDSPLWNEDNVFLSSHKAGMGDSWKKFIGNLIMRNIDNYLEGRTLENKIPLS